MRRSCAAASTSVSSWRPCPVSAAAVSGARLGLPPAVDAEKHVLRPHARRHDRGSAPEALDVLRGEHWSHRSCTHSYAKQDNAPAGALCTLRNMTCNSLLHTVHSPI